VFKPKEKKNDDRHHVPATDDEKAAVKLAPGGCRDNDVWSRHLASKSERVINIGERC